MGGAVTADLLRRLDEAGIEVRMEGNVLRYRPLAAVTPALLADLRDYKHEVLRRVEAMRERLPAEPKPFHLFATAKDVPHGGAGCLSCGDPLAIRTTGPAFLCAFCAHAAQLILDESRPSRGQPSENGVVSPPTMIAVRASRVA